jgi:transposase
MSERKRNKVYSEEFKRQAVELLINSGKPQAQLARELGCSDMSLSGWKRKYLKNLAPAKLEGGPQQPEELVVTIKQQQKEIEYLRRQREILKKAMSILGEEPNPGMR